jgi:hypothetical protein
MGVSVVLKLSITRYVNWFVERMSTLHDTYWLIWTDTYSTDVSERRDVTELLRNYKGLQQRRMYSTKITVVRNFKFNEFYIFLSNHFRSFLGHF